MERRKFLQAVSAGAAVATIGSGSAVARALSPKCDSAEPCAEPGSEPPKAGSGKGLDWELDSTPGRTPTTGQGDATPEDAPVVEETVQAAPEVEAEPDAPAPWWLLAPWGRGSHIAFGWHLQQVSPVIRGGFELVLARQDGARARVAACRSTGRARGVVQNDAFDLVLVNFGAGDRRTDEPLARVMTVVAAVMQQNAKAGDASTLAYVLPYEQRVHRFGEGVLL